jgi:transcriptional regulator with XRE-family HTH domain
MIEVKQEKKKREEFQICFGKHLKTLRIEKGISGAELARRCYMDKPNITRLEKGRINPSLYILKKICEALEINLYELMKDFNC